MFIVDLTYNVPLQELDAAMNGHVKFLKQYYKKNIFIVSGRKVPRTGGIILARAESKDDLKMIMEQDPFVVNKLAEYKIIEFLSSQYHPEFKAFI